MITAAAEYRRLARPDRRARRLVDLSDAGIDEMLAARIPTDHHYNIADIPG